MNRRAPTFAGYVVVRKDRLNEGRNRERMGGGLINVIKKDLVYKELMMEGKDNRRHESCN